MRMTFEVKPGNRLGKRVERPDKRDQREQRRAKEADRNRAFI